MWVTAGRPFLGQGLSGKTTGFHTRGKINVTSPTSPAPRRPPLVLHPRLTPYKYTLTAPAPTNIIVAPGNPAGWAFTFFKNLEWQDFHGPVGQGLHFTPLGSNNTAELQAVIESLDYLCRHPSKFSNLAIDLYTDSQLVYNLCHDLVIPHSHPQLVQQLRSYLTRALTLIDIAILKVRGHAGNTGNTRADKLAYRGVTSASHKGRHASPARPLLPLLPFSHTAIPAVSSSAAQLSDQVLSASASLQPSEPERFHKEYLSSQSKTLIKQIDNTPPAETETVQKLRKAIRRRVRKDKRQHLCDQLLQDSRGPPSKQWATLKFVRKPYSPKNAGGFTN